VCYTGVLITHCEGRRFNAAFAKLLWLFFFAAFVFERCLRHVLPPKWLHKIQNVYVLEHCNITGMQSLSFRVIQNRWFCHGADTCMSDKRIPKYLLCGHLPDAKRNSDGQRMKFDFTIRTSFLSVSDTVKFIIRMIESVGTGQALVSLLCPVIMPSNIRTTKQHLNDL